MHKIVLLLNAAKPIVPNLNFLSFIAGLSRSGLNAVFLQDTVYASNAELKTPFGLPYVEEITSESLFTENEHQNLAKHIQLFEDSCDRRLLSHTVQCSKGDALKEAVKESRFADYIILPAGITFASNEAGALPSKFLTKFLQHSECPVIIAPDEFDAIDEVVFTCNGSKSAVFAIKQFIHLFPELTNIKTTLLEVKAAHQDNSITAIDRLKALLMHHYNAVHYTVIHGGNTKEALFNMLLGKKNKLLVMGAYEPRFMSSGSTSDLVLQLLDIPLFIAHQ